MEYHSQHIKLPDGRKLGYATYGDPDGYPIVALHGTPGSRLWFKGDDPVSEQLGIRLISTDRPGYGLSTAQAGRKLLDYPGDIELLLNQLEIPHCSVTGTSGGSLFAAACAYALPHRVRKAALIAGVGEFVAGRPPDGMCRENRMAFSLARHLPVLSRLFLSFMRKQMCSHPENYKKQVQQQVSHLCEADRRVMQDPENVEQVLRHLKEANRQGVREAVREMRLVTRPWGFDPEAITCPVEIWHGSEDTLAPVSAMRKLADRIPNATLNEVKGSGHFLDADQDTWAEILKSVKV